MVCENCERQAVNLLLTNSLAEDHPDNDYPDEPDYEDDEDDSSAEKDSDVSSDEVRSPHLLAVHFLLPDHFCAGYMAAFFATLGALRAGERLRLNAIRCTITFFYYYFLSKQCCPTPPLQQTGHDTFPTLVRTTQKQREISTVCGAMLEPVQLDHDEEPVLPSRPYLLLRADQVQARHEALVKEACSLFLLPALPTHYLLQAHKYAASFMSMLTSHEGGTFSS